MTDEQINKAGEEYAKSLGCMETDLSPEDLENLARTDFVAGASFANKHWQEKTRWIPVTERLPELREKQYSIIAKDEEGEMFFHYIGLEIDIHYLGLVFTHWREIE